MEKHDLSWPENKNVDLGMYRIFDVGHAMHRWYQEEYLGPAGVLYGNWQCSRCKAMYKNSTMPEGSCPSCQWKMNGEGEPDGMTTSSCLNLCGGSLFPPPAPSPAKMNERGGCVHCGKWGSWEFIEPKVAIPEYNVYGHTDGLLVDPDSDDPEPYAVLELKTINSRRFWAITEPLAYHLKQVNLYMEGLKVDKCCIVYICKDTNDQKEYWIEKDKKLVADLLGTLRRVDKCKEGEWWSHDKELPPNTVCKTRKNARAKACPAVNQCFAPTDVFGTNGGGGGPGYGDV
jgi:hypothetical protein